MKKRVKMLTSMAAPDWSVAPGDIMEVTAEVADAWTKAGIAQLVDKDVETATDEKRETAAKRVRKRGS